MSDDQTYYVHSGSPPRLRSLLITARYHIVKRVLELMKATEGMLVVDIGTSNMTDFEPNVLQQLYPYRMCITSAAISDGKLLSRNVLP